MASDYSQREAARGGVKAWIRHHPLPRFLVTGALTAAVDLGSLAWLHSGLHLQIALATALAYGIAFVVNFSLARSWAFAAGRSGRAHRQLVRYLLLVGVNLGLTVALVSGLTAAGLYYLAAKLIAIAILAIGNFFAYRHWVFT